jgi:hypothetical protein
MWAVWRNVGASLMLAGSLLGLIGCRTIGSDDVSPPELTAAGVLLGKSPRPEVKPGKQPEVLTVAPSEPRFNQSVFPAQAFRDMNAEFKKPLTADGASSIQSTPTLGGLATPTSFGNSTSGQPLGRQ